jgi:hypothetical protein
MRHRAAVLPSVDIRDLTRAARWDLVLCRSFVTRQLRLGVQIVVDDGHRSLLLVVQEYYVGSPQAAAANAVLKPVCWKSTRHAQGRDFQTRG